MTRYVYIETVGCQMNVLDSEMVAASLKRCGYELVEHADQADTILFNTCSVRQHAEDKIYSALGQLRSYKRARPDVVIGVLGCLAQKDQRQIFARAPHVDVVIGPGQLQQTAELLERARAGAGRQVAVSLGRRDGSAEQIRRSHETFDPLRDPDVRPTPFQAYLRIQIGCDKFCTYCVVPLTRGPEQARPPDQILEEAQVLVAQGCLEITLLGQTVNSYRYRAGGRTTHLADLLYRLHDIPGLRRLKFVTNYPSDMTPELLQAVRDLPGCSPYLHVPLQSGSNRILARMQRGYTVEEYRDRLALIRAWLPAAAVSSDFIVGFSGETEEDFQQTVAAVRDGRFKNSFIFKYSPRPGTRAAERLPDDVPEAVKRRRNQELLAIQDAISEEDNRRFIGRTMEVLVEGPSKQAVKRRGRRAPNQGPSQEDGRHAVAAPNAPELGQLTGRTPCDRIVVFAGPPQLAGQIVPVAIDDCTAHTLIGSTLREPEGLPVVPRATLLPVASDGPCR